MKTQDCRRKYNVIKFKGKNEQHQDSLNLNCPVQRGAGKLVVVLWVDYNLHDVVSVTLKHLTA